MNGLQAQPGRLVLLCLGFGATGGYGLDRFTQVRVWFCLALNPNTLQQGSAM